MYAPRRFVDHAPYEYDGFEDLPNIDEEKHPKIISWEMNPGDVLLSICGHSMLQEEAPHEEELFCTVLGMTPHAMRPGPTSPPFPELEGVE